MTNFILAHLTAIVSAYVLPIAFYRKDWDIMFTILLSLIGSYVYVLMFLRQAK